MTTSPLAIAALVLVCAAPLSAQQWGGGGVPVAPRRPPVTSLTPRAVFRHPLQVIIVDPSLSVAPFVDPRTVPAPRATGGGTYGPTPISTWGGSPPAPVATRGNAEQPWSSPYVRTTSGRVITSPTYRLPADSAQHAPARPRRP